LQFLLQAASPETFGYTFIVCTFTFIAYNSVKEAKHVYVGFKVFVAVKCDVTFWIVLHHIPEDLNLKDTFMLQVKRLMF
jgi:hypothetical protein